MRNIFFEILTKPEAKSSPGTRKTRRKNDEMALSVRREIRRTEAICPHCEAMQKPTRHNMDQVQNITRKTTSGLFDYQRASRKALDEEYNRIAKEMKGVQFWTKKEFYYLPKILQSNEQFWLLHLDSWMEILG